jgi:hypothetical protein
MRFADCPEFDVIDRGGVTQLLTFHDKPIKN